jgi:nicotinamide mononucleotide adenylyltransferase
VKSKTFALVIGRFQPPCNHHVSMLQEIVKKFHPQKLFIGIGVSVKNDDKNFLQYEEVKELMILILNSLDIIYEIKPISDINNPPKYCDHVKSIFTKINEDNTCLYTENTYTSDCFINYGHKFEVILPTILPMRATLVREMMLNNKNEWKNNVPNHVVKYLEKRKW